MNVIPVNKLLPNAYFDDDSYILEDLFFLPKNLPLFDYHIKLLNNWGIDKVYTNGSIFDIKSEKKEEENKQPLDLEDLFEPPVESIKEDTKITQNKTNQVNKPLDKQPIQNNTPKTETKIITEPEDFKEIYRKWIIMTINFFNEIVNTKNIDKEKVNNLLADIKQKLSKYKNDALMQFGKQIENISYIYRKTIETTILSYLIAESMKLSEFTVSNLTLATLFHDIGMIKIPKAILQKNEALTEEEIVTVQNHTLIGYKYLKDINYSVIVASGALQHHERIDGKGYPNHVTNEKITEVAKIIAVTDAYCAAIAEKPFKDQLHAKDAIQDLLKGGGTAYDPAILRELVKNISFYPVGSLIELSNGNPAKVIGTSGVAMRPIVKVINLTSPNIENGEIIDLSKRNDLYIKGVYRKK